MQQMQDYQTPGGRQGYLRTGQAQAETRLRGQHIGGSVINKFEARNPKFETNSNDQNLNDQNKNGSSNYFGAFVLNFEHLNFDIVSDFDIRISDLLVLS
jgi:hypothetical protein